MSINHHSITINTIQTHTQKITFDGTLVIFPLDFPPETNKSVNIVYSDGSQPTFHFVGAPAYSRYDVIIDPDPRLPTISFPDPFWKGFYAEIEYSYDLRKASSTSIIKSVLSGYNVSPAGMLTYDPAGKEPIGYVVVPAAFAEGSDRQDYIDIKEVMLNGKELDFSQCNWIVYHEEAFPEEEYQEWYSYALEHCVRLWKERPR